MRQLQLTAISTLLDSTPAEVNEIKFPGGNRQFSSSTARPGRN